MVRERVDSFTEAKERYHEHRPQAVAYVSPDIRAGAAPTHSAAGTGMDGIAVDVDALVRAERELADLHDDLFAQLREAGTLTGPLGDGAGPVATHLRQAFLDRADLDGGVQAVLVDYLEELVTVRSAILATLGAYQGVDNDLAARLNRHLAQLAGEADR
ncbi:hypothetical protein [Actinophytocola sediminis]